MNEERIWEKQEYESEKNYNFFKEFYLPLGSNRTVTEAFRNWKRVTKQKFEGVNTNSTWKRMARGEKVEHGQVVKIPNAYTWPERAAAYDDWVSSIKIENLEEARMDIENDEFRDYQKALALWTNAVESLEEKMIFEAQKAADRNVAFDPRDYVRSLTELIKQRDTLSILGRRARRMPTVISEDRLANVDPEKPLEIVWKEPAYKNDEIGEGQNIIHDFLRRKNAAKQSSTSE